MPPRVVGPPRKEACILILDVGASMARAEDDGRESKLIKAQKSVQLRQTERQHTRDRLQQTVGARALTQPDSLCAFSVIQQKLLFTKQE